MRNVEKQKKIDCSGYEAAVYMDDLTLCNSEWLDAINDNPMLCCSAKQGYISTLTESHAAILGGCFFSADYILLAENGAFKTGATPCVTRVHPENNAPLNYSFNLTASAGSNFYLAQIVYRFFSEKHRDTKMYNDLVEGSKEFLDRRRGTRRAPGDGPRRADLHCRRRNHRRGNLADFDKNVVLAFFLSSILGS